ncbi:MAG: 6-pyruvoyl-tetrahydropterin synthase-related protein [Bacilli bacterium]|nr:6-pyruvoyl-tetrahydropterin synthase-related protein [Bacilli bacterium]
MKKNNYIYISIILLATIIMLSKLFINIRYYGHDTLFHTGNIIYLSKTISIHNILGSNIVKLNANPLGYGTWLFYPKLPHLLTAYIFILCKNIYLSMNITYLITYFLSGIACYYLSKKLFNNNIIATISAIIYLSFSYHWCEIYIRDAFTENFMFLTIPLIFLGLFELKDNNKNKFYIYFILGYIIGIYSHLISMIFCTIFIALFLLYYRKYYLKKDKIKALVISTIIVTCICLPFLTSITEHKLLGDYIVFTELFSNKESTILNTIKLKDYFINNQNIENNNIIVYLNYITIILIIITTIFFIHKKNRNLFSEERKLLLFSFLICITLISSKVIWNYLPSFLATIQYPWRLMTFLCLILSLYAPLFLLTNYKFLTPKTSYILLLIISILSITESYNSIFYYKKTQYNYKDIIDSPKIMGWQTEYMPYNSFNILIALRYEKESLYKINNSHNCTISIIEDKFPNLKFSLSKNNIHNKKINPNIPETLKYLEVRNILNSNSQPFNAHIELPRTYYLGYKIKTNNKTIPVHETSKGLVGVNLHNEGIYTLTYEETPLKKISKLIRLLTIISLIIIILRRRINDN